MAIGPRKTRRLIARAEAQLASLGPQGVRLIRASRKHPPHKRLRVLRYAIERLVEESLAEELFDHLPVGPAEFFADERFVGSESIWPALVDDLVELNQWTWDPDLGYVGRYHEAVFTGSIGSGKTTLALWTLAYQLYLLACLRDPHAMWSLKATDEIQVACQSATGALAKKVGYGRFREMVERSPWFQQHFPHRKDLTSEMRFPKKLEVVPFTGADTSALGQNVVFALLDEVNFMEVVQQSQRSASSESYDQASALADTIARRRESRFMRKGRLPGVTCYCSSRNYPGEFTDRKEEEAREDPRVYVWDRRAWETKPAGTFSEERFHVFVGDDVRKPYVMGPEDRVSPRDRHLVLAVPVDFRHQFERDLYGSLRDIAGVATRAKHPFLHDPSVLGDAFVEDRESVFNAQDVDFETMRCRIYPDRFQDRREPRFVHIDLGATGDSCGLACGYVREFVEVDLGGGQYEVMPLVCFDGVLEIRPPPSGEIIFARVRRVVYRLRELGLPIRWVSMDSWQSRDTLQQLKFKGVSTGTVSLEKDTIIYDVAKSALYDGRVECPMHEKAKREWAQLQQDPKDPKRKIDHAPHGSNDCCDAMAGVVYGLTMRRELWARHGVLKDMMRFVQRTRATIQEDGEDGDEAA